MSGGIVDVDVREEGWWCWWVVTIRRNLLGHEGLEFLIVVELGHGYWLPSHANNLVGCCSIGLVLVIVLRIGRGRPF